LLVKDHYSFLRSVVKVTAFLTSLRKRHIDAQLVQTKFNTLGHYIKPIHHVWNAPSKIYVNNSGLACNGVIQKPNCTGMSAGLEDWFPSLHLLCAREKLLFCTKQSGPRCWGLLCKRRNMFETLLHQHKNALSLPYFNTSKMSIEFSIRIQCCVYSWAPGNTSGRWCKRSKQRQSCGLCQNIGLKQRVKAKSI